MCGKQSSSPVYLDSCFLLVSYMGNFALFCHSCKLEVRTPRIKSRQLPHLYLSFIFTGCLHLLNIFRKPLCPYFPFFFFLLSALHQGWSEGNVVKKPLIVRSNQVWVSLASGIPPHGSYSEWAQPSKRAIMSRKCFLLIKEKNQAK